MYYSTPAPGARGQGFKIQDKMRCWQYVRYVWGHRAQGEANDCTQKPLMAS